MIHLDSIYGIYKQSRNAAWQCLLDCHIGRLPVKVSQIAKSTGVKLIANSQVLELTPNQSGKTIYNKSRWAIIFDDEDTIQRRRFTLAHELGHIFLGHNVGGGYTPDEETAANIFASRLLAPACVLWALDIHDAQGIKDLCNISFTAASVRAERMKVLYARNKFLLSDLERQVYNQFGIRRSERRICGQ